jgi:hypothetical protein
MATSQPDPLLDALDAITRNPQSYPDGKVATIFADKPEVLAKVRAAAERGGSHAEIAKVLSAISGLSISDKAVRYWVTGSR